MIEVRLFATFREGREKIQYLDPDQFKIADEVLDHLDIPQEEVAIYLIIRILIEGMIDTLSGTLVAKDQAVAAETLKKISR